MKNILKKFLIIFITVSMIISINLVSNAENELIEDDFDSNKSEMDNKMLYDDSYEDDFTNDSGDEKTLFSISSKDVTVGKEVIGDVFICTSGTATINSYISGNVFICAKNIEISEDAQITSSLFAVSEKLNIFGNVKGNVYAVSQYFTLQDSGFINLDLFLTAQNININGYIDRDAKISGENITISENSCIAGDLIYSSEREINIPTNAVNGNIKFYDSSSKENTNENETKEWIYSAISYIIFVVIIFIICSWIKCKFTNEHSNFMSDLPKYLLFGILGLIVTPIVSIILLIFGITANLSFLLFTIYFILMAIASASIIIVISSLCSDKLKDKLKINDTLRTILCIIILCIVYKLLKLIPIVGAIVTLAFVILGFGLIVKSILPTKEQNKTN